MKSLSLRLTPLTSTSGSNPSQIRYPDESSKKRTWFAESKGRQVGWMERGVKDCKKGCSKHTRTDSKGWIKSERLPNFLALLPSSLKPTQRPGAWSSTLYDLEDLTLYLESIWKTTRLRFLHSGFTNFVTCHHNLVFWTLEIDCHCEASGDFTHDCHFPTSISSLKFALTSLERSPLLNETPLKSSIIVHEASDPPSPAPSEVVKRVIPENQKGLGNELGLSSGAFRIEQNDPNLWETTRHSVVKVRSYRERGREWSRRKVQ